jgi:hypothetical protein
VTGTQALTGNPETATVNLTGSAAFTSNTSYICLATNLTASRAIFVTRNSGTQFVLTGLGNNTDSAQFFCIGS